MGALLAGMLQSIEPAGGPSLGPPSHVFYVLIGAVSTVTQSQIDTVARLAAPNREICLLHITEPDPSFVGLDAGPAEVQRQVESEQQLAHDRLVAVRERLDEGVGLGEPPTATAFA